MSTKFDLFSLFSFWLSCRNQWIFPDCPRHMPNFKMILRRIFPAFPCKCKIYPSTITHSQSDIFATQKTQTIYLITTILAFLSISKQLDFVIFFCFWLKRVESSFTVLLAVNRETNAKYFSAMITFGGRWFLLTILPHVNNKVNTMESNQQQYHAMIKHS